ncbi:MAG: transporter [Planctomycetaceae bacterium]|nr:transporter [Planctomycetaceae bacterium]
MNPTTISTSGPNPPRTPWIRFDRNEFAGSFGDIGTDLPLIMLMIPAAGLDSASVFIMFGALQILTGLIYGLPMPMQPLKAMALLVITQKIGGDVLYGAGLAIGVIMLVLTLTGLLGWLVRVIPLCVVRGVQMGLGLSLASMALKDYVPSLGWHGYALAGVAFVTTIMLWGNRRLPAALVVIGLGVVYAAIFRLDTEAVVNGAGFTLPTVHTPSWENIWTGLLVLSLPQLALSLSNSVVATHRTLADLYPERQIGVRTLGITYGVTNVITPWFGGIPVCHGCGGLAGHHAFGARTGGSVIIYGSLYVVIGLFFAGALTQITEVFPQPILGVVLLFEALVLTLFSRDIATRSKREFAIALLVALIALALPQGFVIGLAVGTALFYFGRRYRIFGEDGA